MLRLAFAGIYGIAVPVLEYYLRRLTAALRDSIEGSMLMSWAAEVRRSFSGIPGLR